MPKILRLFPTDNCFCVFPPNILQSLEIMWNETNINAAITKYVIHRLESTDYDTETIFGKKVIGSDRRWRRLKVCASPWKMIEVCHVAEAFGVTMSSFMGYVEGWYIEHKKDVDDYAENPPKIPRGRPPAVNTP